MKELRIRSELWLGLVENQREMFSIPRALYFLALTKQTTVLSIIKNLRTPSHYVGAITKCVEDGKLRYMKSHDFHVLMQQVSYTSPG